MIKNIIIFISLVIIYLWYQLSGYGYNQIIRTSSNKIFEQLSFKNKYDIKDAVIDLKIAFEKNLFTDPLNNIEYFNIKKMQNIKLK